MKGKDAGLVLLNTITLVMMLFANFGFNNGVLSNATVAAISSKYDTLFTPAGYAFSIWGVIFFMCCVFVGYQWYLLKKDERTGPIKHTGIWFTVSNICNASWLYCWTNDLIGWSVILIIILLLSLVILTIRIKLELNDEPVRTILFVWWPIAIYLGWIMVATIACIAAWLVSIGWHGGSIGEDTWTIVMITIASALYFMLLEKRNLRETAAVGIWAFVAIAVRQWQDQSNVAITATIAAVLLFLATCVHAYQNRNSNIAAKIKKGE